MSHRLSASPRMALAIISGVVATLVACSEQQQPTSPTTTQSSAEQRLGQAHNPLPVADGIRVPDAKPTDQVGFTKVIDVYGDFVTLNAGGTGSAGAQCPDGTTPVGGGYLFAAPGPDGAQPFVRRSNRINAGWEVFVVNLASGAGTVIFRANAVCAS
jgi:hypothetical protein